MGWNWAAGAREFDRGLQRFARNTKVHLILIGYFLCDILPHMPDHIAKKIVDKFLGLIGLGD